MIGEDAMKNRMTEPEGHLPTLREWHGCASPRVQEGPRTGAPPAPEHGRVLLAEDDAEMRSLLSLVLRAAGHEVTECQDGMQLLDRLGTLVACGNEAACDVIVSDICMPVVSGLRILDGIHERPEMPPMILITAFGDEQTHARAAELGAVAVLDKPFELEDLVSLVEDVIEGRRAEQTGRPLFPCSVVFRHMPPSDELERFALRKAAALNRFGVHLLRCRITIDRTHLHHGQGYSYCVTVRLSLPGGHLIASSHRAGGDSGVFFAVRNALEAARRRLVRQLRRRGRHAP